MQPLNDAEQRAVRYYEGDVRGASDPFWGDAKAYVSLNALLFDGLRTERTRIAEGKRLNPALLADIPALLDVYSKLFAAAGKGAAAEDALGYRVERADDFAVCRDAGMTLAFTSTCRSGFLPAYGDKRGIVLLTYHVPAGTPQIVFAEQLRDYLKGAEDELLLPPFLGMRIAQRALTDADCRMTDMEGKPPLAAYDLYLTGKVQAGAVASPGIPPCEAGIRVWNALNAGAEPDAADVSSYLEWKRLLSARLFCR